VVAIGIEKFKNRGIFRAAWITSRRDVIRKRSSSSGMPSRWITGSLAHYQLAQCYLRQAEWLQAQIELLTTVELDPRNSRAQLDLGRFMFEGRQFKHAKERAQLVLKDNPQM